VETLIHHFTADFVQHRRRIFAKFGERMVNRSVAALLKRKLHGAIRQGRVKAIDLVNQTIAKTPASFGIEVEAHRHLILDWWEERKNIYHGGHRESQRRQLLFSATAYRTARTKLFSSIRLLCVLCG
jgi:hypothetical protein